MNIIHMIDDFQILCEELDELGPFEAYKRYISKYPELFKGILEGLYMTGVESLKPMIEAIDFKRNLQIAKNNYGLATVQRLISISKEVVSLLGYKEDFDIYLGLELGNIAGFSAPSPKDRPFIYIGLDREIDETFLKFFIPHELNHMIRVNMIKDIDLFDFMERTVTEGLGSYSPIALYNMEYKLDTISASLGLPNKVVARLIDKRDFLIEKVTGEFGSPLNKEKMDEYFTWSKLDGDKYYLSGYYVGMEIVKTLIDRGYDFAHLTFMESGEIWERYKEEI